MLCSWSLFKPTELTLNSSGFPKSFQRWQFCQAVVPIYSKGGRYFISGISATQQLTPEESSWINSTPGTRGNTNLFSWTPFVSCTDQTHQSTKYIHYSVFSDCSTVTAWQFDSVQVCRGPVFHKMVPWFKMKCVGGGTFELLCVRDSSFLSVLNAVPGVRGGHRTVLTPAHSPLFLPLHLQPPLSVTSLLLLLSLPSCHCSPSIILPPPHSSHYFVSSFVSLSFCPVRPSSLSFCFISSISQSSHVPPLCLPLQPNCTGVIHLSLLYSQSPESNQFPTAELRPTDSKAMMGHACVIFHHLLAFCFQR